MLSYFFHWYSGAIWGNLAASVIWAAPAIWHLHRKLNRHHEEHKQLINELKKGDK
jgi:preprotein translocase subunit YajC